MAFKGRTEEGDGLKDDKIRKLQPVLCQEVWKNGLGSSVI